MDMLTPEVTQLIGSVGFPIVAFFMMFYQSKAERERQALRDERMTEALNSLREAVTVLTAEVRGRQ